MSKPVQIKGLSYVVRSRSWYASTVPMRNDSVEEVYITLVDPRDPDDGCFWEFGIREHEFNTGCIPNKTAWRVEVFDDAWKAFQDVAPVFQSISRLKDPITLEKIEKVLKKHGAVDRTELEAPSWMSPTEEEPKYHQCSRCHTVEKVK